MSFNVPSIHPPRYASNKVVMQRAIIPPPETLDWINGEFSEFQKGEIKSAVSLNSFGEHHFVHFVSNFQRNYTLLLDKLSPLFFLMSILANDPRERARIDTPVLRYRVYTRRIRRLLYLGGILQDRTRSVAWSYITGLLVILMCFSQCIFMINFCLNIDNLVFFAKCFGMTCSAITPVLMSICFLMKREKLIGLHEMLNDLFEQELTRNRETKAIMLANMHTFERPSYIMVFILASTILMIVCPSVISTIRLTVHHANPKEYRLPFPAKFLWPAPIGGSLSFYLHLLYQIFISWWMIFTIGSVDSLFGYYAFQISSILRAMSFRLMNLRTRKEFTEVLGKCVYTHHQLLRCGRILSDVWGLIIVRLLLTNAILMCTLIFELSPFTHLTMGQIILFIFYMTLKLLQTFIYAWYGTLITSASEHFCERIYFSKWPDSSLDRDVRANIIVTMMQKPIVIKALKLSSVNVNLFTNIVNTAMSYFFLLQSLNEDR